MILDANILIALLDADDALSEQVEHLLVDTAGSPLKAAGLTIVESLVVPARRGVEHVAYSRLRSLGVTTVTLDQECLELARVRARTGLKMPDAVVLLAAQLTGEPLATFDDRLAQTARDDGVVVVPDDATA